MVIQDITLYLLMDSPELKWSFKAPSIFFVRCLQRFGSAIEGSANNYVVSPTGQTRKARNPEGKGRERTTRKQSLGKAY